MADRFGRAAGQSRLRVLHLVLRAGETSAAYNEHCLAFAAQHEISVCAYFPRDVAVAPGVRFFAGDGSVPGFFRAARAALASGPYDVVHAHAPHVALALMAQGLGRVAKWRAATVFTVHTSYPNVRPRNRLMMAAAFVRFDRVVCCSEASFASFPAPFRRLAGSRLAVVRNGVDVRRIDRAARSEGGAAGAERNGRGFTLVTVGRLIEVKDPLLVVGAFASVARPADRLVCIGDGPMGATVRSRSRECGADAQVEVTGVIPRDAVYGRLKAADLFVSASRVEGLPVAVLEAMACACPVVLSDIAPHREIAAGAEFIPLVEPGDGEGFAREIRRIQRLADEERAGIGARCRALVLDRFSVETMGRGYEEIYRRVLRAKRGPAAQAPPFTKTRDPGLPRAASRQ